MMSCTFSFKNTGYKAAGSHTSFLVAESMKLSLIHLEADCKERAYS